MDVSWSVPKVFESVKFKNLHNRLEATSSSYLVNAYISLGLTRLVGSLPDELDPFQENPVTNTLHDIGTMYVETWFHILYLRKEAKRVNQEIREIKTLFCWTPSQQNLTPKYKPKLQVFKLFQRTLSEKKELAEENLKYSRKKSAAVKKFMQSMEDTFEGNKFKARIKTTIALDDKLWKMQEKFRKIVMLLNAEQLMLPQRLRRDVTRNIALPDLISCHTKLKKANAKLLRAERKWVIWKCTHGSESQRSSETVHAALSKLLACVLCCILLYAYVRYYHNKLLVTTKLKLLC